MAGTLPVNNTGDADFDYVATAVTADRGTPSVGSANAAVFAQNLTVTVYSGGTSDGSTCSGGTEISSTALDLGATDIISSSRRIAVGATERLCVKVGLNSDAPVAARMSALNIGFQFTATQA